MVHRSHVAFAAILVALPLFAFPLASPPPDPGTRVRVSVHEMGSGFDDADERFETHNYTALSAGMQRLFDSAARSETRISTPADGAPALVQDLADGASSTAVVVRNGNYYGLNVHAYRPGPSLSAVLLRLGAMAGAVALAFGGGYVLVNAP